ncbi:MAG: EF-P lysine aminoacylase GenX [Alphaproteobacteria bacterium]|nr:EF-P lysine aminoacylase GenX [Alphaproteobacteria bacterium]
MPETWWDQSAFSRRRANLQVRNQAIGAVREYLTGQGFIEVDTPAIQVSPGIDRHIRPFKVNVRGPFESADRRRFLHTSPEFCMKKLLAAGEQKIFQICHVYRDGEEGHLHHPEFTLLEWYRAQATYDALMEDVINLASSAAAAVGQACFRHRGYSTDINQAWNKLSVSQAFAEYAGIDLLAEVTGQDELPSRKFVASAEAAGVRCDENDRWDDVFHRVMLECIEPQISDGPPTLLTDFPTPVGALARPKAADSRVCERVEAYACGIELANGFSELTDPIEQRRRFSRDQSAYARLHGEAPPIDEDFLSALAQVPESAGMALGVDRLIMLLTGADHIRDVLWAPVDMDVE